MSGQYLNLREDINKRNNKRQQIELLQYKGKPPKVGLVLGQKR